MTDVTRIALAIDSRQVRNADRELGSMQRSGQKAESAVSKLGKSLVALGAGVAVVKALSSSLQEAAQFETALVGVAKTTGLAGMELQSLAGRLDQISKEIPVTTAELLGMAQAAGQMGVTGAANLEKFSVTVAKLGRASDLSGEQAATALARILNVTGENIDSIDTLASVIVSLGNNVAATESEIARMTTEVARSTAAFGVSSAEAAAMAAAMTSLGIRAELGGSSVGRTMQEITSRVQAGGKDLREFAQALGLNADTLSELFASNKTDAFQYFLEQVGELGLDAGNALETVGLGGQEIAKTIIPLSTNMGVFARTMGLANDQVQNATALNTEFEATLQTLDSQWIITKNIMESASRDIGNTFLPTISDALADLNQALASGFIGARVEAIGGKFEIFADDAGRAIVFVTDLLDVASREWGDEGRVAVNAITSTFANLPENIHAAIQLVGVELAVIVDLGKAYAEAFTVIFVSEFDKIAQHAGAYGREIADALNPFSDDFDLTSATAEIDAAIAQVRDNALQAAEDRVAASRAARIAGIQDILAERDAALKSYDDQVSAANEMFEQYKKDRDDATAADDDAFGSLKTGLEQANEAGSGLSNTLGGVSEGMEALGHEAIKAFRIMQRTQEEGTRGYRNLEVAIQAANVVKAVGAVLNQAEGDPYTAFGRMAVMAGTVASLGVSVGNLGAGGNVSQQRQDTQGTGSVLGMMDEKSESIANATETTASATSELVGINRGMLSALREMQRGITGATSQIARSAGSMNFRGALTSGMAADEQLHHDSLMGLRDPGKALFGLELDFVGDWADDILGGSSEVINEGVRLMGGTMSELINDVMIQAFQDVEEKKHIFDDTDVRRETQNLSDAAAEQFQLIFSSLSDTVRAGAEALGMSSASVGRRIAQFRVAEQEISLQGLNAEERQAELEAVFGTIFDGLVGSVLPFIDEFQRVGEGLGETLARVATNVQVTEEAVSRLGFAAERLSVEQFANLSTDLIEAAGGLDQFISGMGSFVDKFATEEHKFDVIQSDMQRAFERVNLEIPETRDGMWELMQTLDAGTAAGREQIAALLELSDVADQYYDQQDRALREAARISNERLGLERQLLRIQGDTDALRAMELESLDDSNRALQERIWALQDQAAAEQEAQRAMEQARQAGTSAVNEVASAIRNELSGITSAADTLRGQASSQPSIRSGALSTLRDAMLTGDLSGTGEAARVAAQINARDFSSAVDFQREQARTLFLLDSLEREGNQQIGIAEQTLNVLEEIDGGISDIADALDSFARAIVFDGSAANVPQFASGGVHAGGLRIVGERGPELEMTGPSRIASNSDLNRALATNAELIKELRDMKAYFRQVTKNTGDSRDQLNRWNRDGLPEPRDFDDLETVTVLSL